MLLSCVFYLLAVDAIVVMLLLGLFLLSVQVLVPHAGTRSGHIVPGIVYIYIPSVIYLRFAVNSVLSEFPLYVSLR